MDGATLMRQDRVSAVCSAEEIAHDYGIGTSVAVLHVAARVGGVGRAGDVCGIETPLICQRRSA